MENIVTMFQILSNHKICEKTSNSIRLQTIKGSNNIVSIPLHLTEDLSYIVATIICDGHLKKDKYRIVFENINMKTIKKFSQKFQNIFGIRLSYSKIIDKRPNRQIRYRIEINSKPIVVLLNKIFEIDRGKKSHCVKIPLLIKNSNYEIKKSFIEGVFDTDGGKRKKTLGLSSKSEQFRDDVAETLSELGIEVKKDEWINKIYKQKYYGLYFKRRYPSGQRGQLSYFINKTGLA